jgi:hypothetical protein
MSLQLSRDIQLLSIYSRIKVYHKLDILVEKKLSTEIRRDSYLYYTIFFQISLPLNTTFEINLFLKKKSFVILNIRTSVIGFSQNIDSYQIIDFDLFESYISLD